MAFYEVVASARVEVRLKSGRNGPPAPHLTCGFVVGRSRNWRGVVFRDVAGAAILRLHRRVPPGQVLPESVLESYVRFGVGV